MAIVFAGDIRVLPGRTVITRGDLAGGSYARIIIWNGEVEGATMINRTADLQPLLKIIEHNVKIEPYLAQLADPAFDLKTLIPKTP
jgi:NAD(P)H-nitrite reductase large subunit